MIDIQQEVSEKWNRRRDEQTERALNYLLREDENHQQNIDLFLQISVNGARQGNWPCMRHYLQLYCEQESKRLGGLANFMEKNHVVLRGGKRAVVQQEMALLRELESLCLAYADPEKCTTQWDAICNDEKRSNQEKHYNLSTLRHNVAYCKEVLEWLETLPHSSQEQPA